MTLTVVKVETLMEVVMSVVVEIAVVVEIGIEAVLCVTVIVLGSSAGLMFHWPEGLQWKDDASLVRHLRQSWEEERTETLTSSTVKAAMTSRLTMIQRRAHSQDPQHMVAKTRSARFVPLEDFSAGALLMLSCRGLYSYSTDLGLVA